MVSEFKGLNSVNFGNIAAENEKDHLIDYFLETNEYRKLINDSRNILVIGRKGSGKTAIYLALSKYLPKNVPDSMIEALTLEDYPWEIHKRIQDMGVPSEQSYINSWKYIIWTILAKKIVGYSEIGKYKLVDGNWWKSKINVNFRFIRQFLKINYGSIAPGISEILADATRNVRALQFDKLKVELGADNDKYTQLARSINVMCKELQERILAVASNKKSYYVLLDGLDLGWDGSKEMKFMLIGLIRAARSIVNEALEKKRRIHVVIFLRSDIYETLKFEDKNHLSQNLIELVWDEYRLREMVEKRIQFSSCGDWNDVFSGGEMAHRQQQLDYICKRTLLRPRDMIQFCIFSKEVAIKTYKSKIDNDSIYDAANPYSNYLRAEFDDECKTSLPQIASLFNVLKKIKVDKITYEELTNEIKAQKIDMSPEKAIEALIDLGVIGIYRKGGRSGGTEIVYRYQVPPWENMEPTQILRVHPGLKETLGLVEYRESRK
jgi:hypothetical protein